MNQMKSGSSLPTGWKLKIFSEKLIPMKEFRRPLLSNRLVTMIINIMKEMKSFIKKKGKTDGPDQPKLLGRKVQRFVLYMQDMPELCQHVELSLDTQKES